MEQLMRNIDILKTIFNYLKLEEQINAAPVCPEFHYTIVNSMWRYRYRHISVYTLNGDTFIINTKHKPDDGKCETVNEYFEDLKHKEFKIFFKLNQANVIELDLCDWRSKGQRFCFINKWKFTNLTVLTLQFLKLDVKELERIFGNCRKLVTLRLKQCYNSNFESITLKDHDNCDYEILLKIIKMLREFHLEYRELQFSESSLNLHDVLCDNNLKFLNLNVPLQNLRYKETPRLRGNTCETLQIGIFNEHKTLQKFTRLYLHHFRNILNLTIEGSLNKVYLDTKFIENLSTTCCALKAVNFKRCLINVQDFSLLSTIVQISLDNCMCLTWRNLRQLLELPILQSFHTTNSTYTRELEKVSIPFHLKALTLVGNEFRFAQIFLNPEEKLTNLKQLIYYDGSDAEITKISQKFPNLEVLHILPHHVDIQDLLNLKNLKIFNLPIYCQNQSKVLNLMHLIKLPSLRELSLLVGELNFSNELPIYLSECKTTKLQHFTLDFDLFNYLFEFLLDLLNSNSKLKLIVFSDDIADFQYFYNLVQNRKFRRESLKLCGFQIDCKDFTLRPKLVERKLELIKELSDYKNVYFII